LIVSVKSTDDCVAGAAGFALLFAGNFSMAAEIACDLDFAFVPDCLVAFLRELLVMTKRRLAGAVLAPACRPPPRSRLLGVFVFCFIII